MRTWGEFLRACCVVAAACAACAEHDHNKRRVVLSPEQEAREPCHNHLRNLYCVCRLYADERGGELPRDLRSLLIENYTAAPYLFLCPNASRAVLASLADMPKGPGDASLNFDGHTDYGYVSGLTTAGKPTWILIFDKYPHPGGIRNVRLVHMNVMRIEMTEDQFQRELATTLKEAKAAGYDVKVVGYEIPAVPGGP